MNWTDRLRLAYRALRGGFPPSHARDSPLGWERPPETLEGWDSLLSDSTILYHQLGHEQRRKEDLAEELEHRADDVRNRVRDLTAIADFEVDDESLESHIHSVARSLESYAEMMDRRVDESK